MTDEILIRLFYILNNNMEKILVLNEKLCADFISLYESDKTDFILTLNNLLTSEHIRNDNNEFIFKDYQWEMSQVYLAMLGLYFGANKEAIVSSLRRTIKCLCIRRERIEIEKNGFDEFMFYLTLRKSFEKIISIVSTKGNTTFHTYHNNNINDVLNDLIRIEDIIDLETACLYMSMHSAGLVKKVPAFIRPAIRTAAFCDNLIGDGLDLYICSHSKERFVEKCQFLLFVGYDELYNLILDYYDCIHDLCKPEKQAIIVVKNSNQANYIRDQISRQLHNSYIIISAYLKVKNPTKKMGDSYDECK